MVQDTGREDGLVRVMRAPLAQQVYSSIRQAVVDGALAPEEDLSEVGLAERLGVSRTPVREAIGRLTAEGFVTRRGDSLTVPALSREECLNLYAVRERLEALAAREAALRAGTDDVARLEAANARVIEQYRQATTAAELAAVGSDFHEAVAVVSSNRKNLEFLQNLMLHVKRYRQVGAHEGRDVYVHDHTEILAAIRDQDPERAEAAMAAHVRHARDLVIERFPDADQLPTAG